MGLNWDNLYGPLILMAWEHQRALKYINGSDLSKKMINGPDVRVALSCYFFQYAFIISKDKFIKL